MDLAKLYKEAFEEIVKQFKKDSGKFKGKEITDIKYKNGYFIFEKGDNSVVHFKVKGCKNWLFGCWFSFDETKKSYQISAEIFCQHERYLDKFKPSRGTYNVEFSINVWNDTIDLNDYGYLYQLHQICDFIHKHPYLAYNKDTRWTCDYNYQKQQPVKAFFQYYIDGVTDWKNDTVSNYLDNKTLEYVKKYAADNFSEYNWKILDEGENTAPRYSVQVELPDNDPQETGIFGLFDTEHDEIAWNDFRVKCKKISDFFDVCWFSNVADTVVFWNKKEWDAYQAELNERLDNAGDVNG